MTNSFNQDLPAAGMLKPDLPKTRVTLPLTILFFALILNAVGHAFFTMTFPAVGRQMGLVDFQTGLVMSLSALIATLAAPVWGVICEYWGRRKVLATGLFAAGFFIACLALVIHFRAVAVLGVSAAFSLLLLTRLLHAGTTASVMPGAQALVADLTAPGARVKGMGMLGAAFGLGSLGGGALAMTTGSNLIIQGFAVIACVLFVAALVLWLRLPETATGYHSLAPVKIPFAKILPSLLITLICLVVYSSLQQVTALRLQDDFGMNINESVRFTGAIMMASTFAMILVQSLGLSLLNWPPQRLIFFGAFITALAMLIGAFAVSAQMLLGAMALMGLGLGALLPGNLATLSLFAGPNQQAKVAGINGICQGIGMALGPMLGVAMYSITPSTAYFANAFLLMLVTIIVLWMKPRTVTAH